MKTANLFNEGMINLSCVSMFDLVGGPHYIVFASGGE